ncbi:MAG: phosphoribosyltransferase [Candidatus Bathyarchaeota archaeon]|nr:phosphoribosyltransferase [Candidatus Bathyarchaeota archaeon]
MAFFSDRIAAGKLLAQALKDKVDKNVIVLAIPRGGVVVGFEVARELGAELDVVVPRKLGAPGDPELAIGAIAEDGTVVLDKKLMEYLGVSEAYVTMESERQRLEIQRRLKTYRGDQPPLNLEDRDVVLVDDGIATGSTMKAALASARKNGAKRLIVAVPVGPFSADVELEEIADEVVFLYKPRVFNAIGEFYTDFTQTTDAEVKALLKKAREDFEHGKNL